jgi:ATP citrate (pro-S)-lyase
LNLDLEGVEEFVQERLGKVVEVSGTKGPVTHFIVEPFVPHDEEYYLSITSQRLGADVRFSDAGGVDIEEHWDKVSLCTLFFTCDRMHLLYTKLLGGLGTLVLTIC